MAGRVDRRYLPYFTHQFLPGIYVQTSQFYRESSPQSVGMEVGEEGQDKKFQVVVDGRNLPESDARYRDYKAIFYMDKEAALKRFRDAVALIKGTPDAPRGYANLVSSSYKFFVYDVWVGSGAYYFTAMDTSGDGIFDRVEMLADGGRNNNEVITIADPAIIGGLNVSDLTKKPEKGAGQRDGGSSPKP